MPFLIDKVVYEIMKQRCSREPIPKYSVDTSDLDSTSNKGSYPLLGRSHMFRRHNQCSYLVIDLGPDGLLLSSKLPPDHIGTVILTVVPLPGWDCISIFPPSGFKRSLRLNKPKVLFPCIFSISSGSKPLPSSLTEIRT